MKGKKLSDCQILVTPTSFGKNDPDLFEYLESIVGNVVFNTTGHPMTSDALLNIITDIDGYIAGLDEIDHRVINKAKNLKVISRYGTGVDNIDLKAAHEKGIVVTNTPGVNSNSVAELTVGLMLAVGRDIVNAALDTKSGKWPRIVGVSLEGKSVGLIGFGSIGKQVARRLAGFDCKVFVYDPIITESDAIIFNAHILPIEDLISMSDFLSLHCPLDDRTIGMVNTEFIGKMKNGSILINTARGELVDELALLQAIGNGKLKGAALDVFTKQPPEIGNELLKFPQVIATPHMGAHSDCSITRMGWTALNECLAVLRGEKTSHRVV
jgi:D-3-phosphoglycerate dehydrogenase